MRREAAKMTDEPVAELDARYSEPNAKPTTWQQASQFLAEAEVFWLSTVRLNGLPHVTPLLAVWLDSTLYFSTGPDERKCQNLVVNPHAVLTTGNNTLNGLDVVVEGRAVRVTDGSRLRRLADAWSAKYGPDWRFEVRGSSFFHPDGGEAWVFALRATTAFGFGKSPYSQTRWRLDQS
jgi:general stress protein 26